MQIGSVKTMLTAYEETLFHRVKSKLSTINDSESSDLIAALDAALLANSQHRAAITDARRANPTGKRGAPGLAYTIEQEPGWQQTVHGASAAHAALRLALADLGAAHRLPTPAGLASTLSKNGYWAVTVEGDNGTVQLSARKA